MHRLVIRSLSVAAKTGNVLVWISVGVFFLWAIGAIYYLLYLPPWLRIFLAAAYVIAIPYYLWRIRDRSTARAWIAGSVLAVYLATLLIRPSNDRVWDPDQAKVAMTSIQDGIVTINNFRSCRYRSESDYDMHFQTKRFPLERIDSVWFLVQKFTAAESLAHVFLSIGLKPDPEHAREYFSVSVEIRRELGETYDPIKGLYRNYELTHVIGDERDLIGVRTVHRPDDRVYMYRVNATPEQAQHLFVKFADRIQSLQSSPQFYHSLLNNCANGITGLTYELTPEPINWRDSRIVLPGHSGQFAWESGLIGDRAGGQTFEQLEASSRIDELARAAGVTETFSHNIRSVNRKP